MSGKITREALDRAMEQIAKQGSEPRHVCDLDGHVPVYNHFGFHRCMYCGRSEADLERP